MKQAVTVTPSTRLEYDQNGRPVPFYMLLPKDGRVGQNACSVQIVAPTPLPVVLPGHILESVNALMQSGRQTILRHRPLEIQVSLANGHFSQRIKDCRYGAKIPPFLLAPASLRATR